MFSKTYKYLLTRFVGLLRRPGTFRCQDERTAKAFAHVLMIIPLAAAYVFIKYVGLVVVTLGFAAVMCYGCVLAAMNKETAPVETFFQFIDGVVNGLMVEKNER